MDNKLQSKDYNIYEPTIGHFNRFQAKLKRQEKPKQKTNWYKIVAVAASLLLLFALVFNYSNTSKGFELADVSPKMEETQDYFNTVIHQELEKINNIKNQKNQKIINDALIQLQFLENDYNKQKIELASNTKNKSIIYAMISNYQQRIDVLQNLLKQLNQFKKINNKYNENNNI